MASLVGYKPEIIDIVIAVIIYFSAFAMIMNTSIKRFFVNKVFKKKKKLDKEQDSTNEKSTKTKAKTEEVL